MQNETSNNGASIHHTLKTLQCQRPQVRQMDGSLQVMAASEVLLALQVAVKHNPEIRKIVRGILWTHSYREKGRLFRKGYVKDIVAAKLAEYLSFLLTRRVPESVTRGNLRQNRHGSAPPNIGGQASGTGHGECSLMQNAGRAIPHQVGIIAAPAVLLYSEHGGSSSNIGQSKPAASSSDGINTTRAQDWQRYSNPLFSPDDYYVPVDIVKTRNLTPSERLERVDRIRQHLSLSFLERFTTDGSSSIQQSLDGRQPSISNAGEAARPPKPGGGASPAPRQLAQALFASKTRSRNLRQRLPAQPVAEGSNKLASIQVASRGDGSNLAAYLSPAPRALRHTTSARRSFRLLAANPIAYAGRKSNSVLAQVQGKNGSMGSKHDPPVMLRGDRLCYQGAIKQVLALIEAIEELNGHLRTMVAEINAMKRAIPVARLQQHHGKGFDLPPGPPQQISDDPGRARALRKMLTIVDAQRRASPAAAASAEAAGAEHMVPYRSAAGDRLQQQSRPGTGEAAGKDRAVWYLLGNNMTFCGSTTLIAGSLVALIAMQDSPKPINTWPRCHPTYQVVAVGRVCS